MTVTPTIGSRHLITMAYGGSHKPPFVARGILAVHHQHLEAKAAAARRAGMQEDPAVRIALVPANSNQMGSHITSDCCVQRSRSAKLYALRTGRHGGQREQRLSRPSLTKTANLLRGAVLG